LTGKEDMSLLLNRMDEFTRIYRKLDGMILEYYDINESAAYLIELLKSKEMTLKQITEESKLDKSTVSRQVNALVKKEYIIKTTGKDKRYTYLQLSHEAKDIYKKYKEEAEIAFADLLSEWTEEEKQAFSILLSRLNSIFSEAL